MGKMRQDLTSVQGEMRMLRYASAVQAELKPEVAS